MLSVQYTGVNILREKTVAGHPDACGQVALWLAADAVEMRAGANQQPAVADGQRSHRLAEEFVSG
jgi:hypothetical protein